MRLDRQQRDALAQALLGVPGEVFLFGSRVDDQRRGGDIDLLILTSEPASELSQRVVARYQMACDEKIDVVVIDPARASTEQRAFLQSVNKQRWVA